MKMPGRALASLMASVISATAIASPVQAEARTIAGWYHDFDDGVCSIWRYEKNNMFVMFEDDWREEPSLIIQVSGIKEKPQAGQLVSIDASHQFTVAEGRKYDGTAGFSAPMHDGFLQWLSERNQVALKIGEQGPAVLSLLGLTEAFAAYQACIAKRAQDSESSRVFEGPEFAGLSSMDGAKRALSAFERRSPSQLLFRAHVAASGKPENCEPLESTGDAELDTKLCDIILAHGVFRPGRTKSGEAAAGYYKGLLSLK